MSLARLNAVGAGICTGALAALAVWIATVFLVVRGGPTPGQHLSLLGEYLPGYDVSLLGAFIGAAGTFVLAFLFIAPSAWIYYLGTLRLVGDGVGGLGSDERRLDGRVLRISPPSFALAIGVGSGIVTLLATWILLLKHQEREPLGPHLGFLREYLPGYSISMWGGLVGLAYFLVLGTLAGLCVAGLYNALVSWWAPSREGSEGADRG